MRWTVLVPMRSLPSAKSRLVELTADARAHRALVEAIRRDTLAAVTATDGVDRVVLVVDEAIVTDHDMVVQRAPGLNAAVVEAQLWAHNRWPSNPIAAVVGDLPALRPADLASALEAAQQADRAFVPDSSGAGTTMLSALPGVELRPAFGDGSAARHASIAEEVEAAASLRLDVDTPEDLAAASTLGVGPQTAKLIAEMGRLPPRGMMSP